MLDIEPFLQVKRDSTSGFRFITTGALIPRKNHSMLLDAFAALHSEHNDTYLGIIGEGCLDQSLKKQAKSLGIADAVTFYGWVSHSEMAKIYSSYDCFVFPSWIETFGVALAEAMAAGMPVIAARCGGPEDFVREDDGILTQPGNLAELTGAMRKMYHSRAQYDGAKIRAYTAENFSPSHIARKIINVYEEVCR